MTRPRLWKRYVDDTFYILRKDSTKELLCHLNGVRPTIMFTVEQEENGALPFLDTLLRRREDGSLDVSVYRKSIHTDQYLHFEYHHPTHVKRGVVRCLHDRVRGIISMQDNLQKEVDYLARVLKQNGYLTNFICDASAPPTQKTADVSSPGGTGEGTAFTCTYFYRNCVNSHFCVLFFSVLDCSYFSKNVVASVPLSSYGTGKP